MQTEEILRLAVEGINFCENGGALDEYLDVRLSESESRRSVSSILFNYFRNKGIVDFYIDKFCKGKTRPGVRRILSAVFTQILYQSAVPVPVLADVAVSFARKNEGRGAAMFVNAMIRQLARHRKAMTEEDRNIVEGKRVPKILLDRWKKNFSKEGLGGIIDAIKAIPIFTFRAVSENVDAVKGLNCMKVEGLEFLNKFKFFVTEEPGAVLDSCAMRDGKIYVQDPADRKSVV